jgi:hypothetical protein
MHCQIILAAVLLAAGPASDESPRDLQLQYARAKLQLAQTNLKRVEEMNRKLARSVPASVVSEFQSAVAEAQLQVGEAGGDEFAVWLRRAESELQSTTVRWRNALAANERLRRAKDAKPLFDALDVERFRLRAEVNRLQWERGKSLVGGPRAAQLAWQVELLNNEVEYLKEEVPRFSPFIRYYPVYWY